MAVKETTREELHRLIDELPEGEWHAAARFLAYLRDIGSDPFLRALMAAPEDDEPEMPEEEAAMAAARAAVAHGEIVSDEELRRELGL